MARIVGCLAVAGVVAALAAWGARAPDFSESLAAPAVGEVRPDQLSDGSPVFVMRDSSDEVRVLSAVSTHLEHVVAWCPQERVFVEPVGATRMNVRGRWLGGPAPTGLAAYEARLSPSRRQVRVGALGEPPARWDFEGAATSPERGCAESEGRSGGQFPPGTDPADAITVADLTHAPLGRFTAVRGTMDFRHQPARLCSSATGRCPADAVRVRDFFWDHLWDGGWRGFATSVQGVFLVRRAGTGVVDRAALLPRLTMGPPAYTYTVTWTAHEDDRSGWTQYVGVVDGASLTAQRVVLRSAGGFRAMPDHLARAPSPDVPALLTRISLHPRLTNIYDQSSLDGMRFIAPERFAEHVRKSGAPVAVRFHHRDGSLVRGLHVYETLDDALADG